MKGKQSRKNFHKEKIFTLEQNKLDFGYIEKVRKKAYELHEQRGHQHGRAHEDWTEAEKLVGRSI